MRVEARERLLWQHCYTRTIYQSSDFLLLFSYIVYFVYFTNYFRVCIFVYLLTINFVRVLIVYFQNIVYSCITINFIVSYLKIAHTVFITFHASAINYYTFVTLYEPVHVLCMYLCCLFHIFQCEYRCNLWPKVFKGGGRGKTRSWKFS